MGLSVVCKGAPPKRSTVETLVDKAGEGEGEEEEVAAAAPALVRGEEGVGAASAWIQSREALDVRETIELRRLVVLVVRLRRKLGEDAGIQVCRQWKTGPYPRGGRFGMRSSTAVICATGSEGDDIRSCES